MRKRKNNLRKNIFSPALFISFILVAIFLIVLLEYLEFNKSGNSFIFNNIFRGKNSSVFASEFNHDLLEVLNRNEISFDYFKDVRNRYHFKIDPEKKEFESIKNSLKRISKKSGFALVPVEVKRIEGRTIFLFKTKSNGKTFHIILLSKPKIQKKDVVESVKVGGGSPRIAFIIDDIGAHSLGALELKKLGIPITASILPFSARGFEEAKWVHEYGLEEMIHLPMQPKKDAKNGYALKNTVKIDSSENYIRSLLKKAEKIVPYARGVNNHQGSLVTSNKTVMKKILGVIKGERLFFVDSRTDFDSIAYQTAREMGVRSAKRDVFIDHIQDYSQSMFQIKRLVKIAKKHGQAIAIGHPFKTTLKAISDSIKFIRDEGIEIVFVKDLTN